MSLTTAQKIHVMKDFKISDNDVGSTPVQISLLTTRIKELTAHLQKNRKDLHSQRGLLIMVGRRRRLMAYLKRTNLESYQSVLSRLNLRG